MPSPAVGSAWLEDSFRAGQDACSNADLAYAPERDMGAAPLNTEARRFNPVATPAPLRELEREPGPFSVHRYLVPESGVPTFAGAKVAIWPEDLEAGGVDVAIVGVPGNFSSGRRDAGNGPNAMRALNTIATPDVKSLIRPLEALDDYHGDQQHYLDATAAEEAEDEEREEPESEQAATGDPTRGRPDA